MNTRSTVAFRALKSAVTLGAAALVVTLAGCGEDTPTNPNNQTPPPTSTTYTGAVTSGSAGGNGTLSVTIQTGTPAPGLLGAAPTVVATGVFTPTGGSPITLTGTYNTDANTFTITDGTWVFDGGLTTFGMEGNIVAGPGGITGSFSLFVGTTSVIVIIGTYSGDSNGNFNFGISGSEVHGNAFDDGDTTPFPLDGTFNASNGDIVIYMPGTTAPPYLAIGNYNPANNPDCSGTWTNNEAPPNDQSGTWTGDKQ